MLCDRHQRRDGNPSLAAWSGHFICELRRTRTAGPRVWSVIFRRGEHLERPHASGAAKILGDEQSGAFARRPGLEQTRIPERRRVVGLWFNGDAAPLRLFLVRLRYKFIVERRLPDSVSAGLDGIGQLRRRLGIAIDPRDGRIDQEQKDNGHESDDLELLDRRLVELQFDFHRLFPWKRGGL